MGPIPLGVSCERGKVPLLWETPSPAFLLVCVVPECLNSGFSAQNWGEDLVWLHADSLKGLECGPGHQCYHMQDGASLLQKLCYQCMQDGTWVCHKTLTVTVLTAGVQLQPQQALLGFTWELGHWS